MQNRCTGRDAVWVEDSGGPRNHVLDGGTNQDAVWVVDSGWPSEAYIAWGAHWRRIANTIEPSMCGGDAVFLSNYFYLI